MMVDKSPISHMLVVGFHHKLGCQVEFSYPPLVNGSSGRNECPSGWKYLPTLALPDGSHNFTEDTVYFNLPSLLEPTESVYGVSCYRQIPVEKLKIRTADMTRSTAQKSVCILMRLPIYGYIEVKLSLIADAYFNQGDFSQTDLLVKSYQQLNACLLFNETRRLQQHVFVGLPLREIILNWRQKALVLFKLLLLQRKVVCFSSPVHDMCLLILGIASLIPRLLEKGFQEVACVRTSRPLSPMPDFTHSIQYESTMSVLDLCNAKLEKSASYETMEKTDCMAVTAAAVHSTCNETDKTTPESTSNSLQREESPVSGSSGQSASVDLSGNNCPPALLTREASVDTLVSTLAVLCAANPDEYRAPISIFTSGNLCLPYLSLPYMDLLSDPSVLSYIIGTSNVLFQQKRQLADVFVDVEAGNIDVRDSELRRQLVLTTEDLRFMDYLLKHVQSPKEDAEGSEHWIRDQFQGYVLALLRTTVLSDATSKDNEHFNAHFMTAFKNSQCYQEWYDVRPELEFFDGLPAGHPFAGTLSVTDMKLKIAQTMQNSESGRKINQAVNTTSRAVGGAISQAKDAFSNWWSSITTTTAGMIQTTATPTYTRANTVTSTKELQLRQQGNSVTFLNSRNADDINVSDVSIHLGSSINVDATDHSLANQVEHEHAKDFEEENELMGNVRHQGIVEIGKEAEMLNKNLSNPQRNFTIHNQHKRISHRCDSNSEYPVENPDVFIT